MHNWRGKKAMGTTQFSLVEGKFIDILPKGRKDVD